MPYEDPAQRQPKGDHNRRLSLGLDPDQFAAEAGVSVAELREYEQTAPDHSFDVIVAGRVGETLDRLEAILPNSQTGRQTSAAGISVDDVGHQHDFRDEHVAMADRAPGAPFTPMTQRGADGRVHGTAAMEDSARAAGRTNDRTEAVAPAPTIIRAPD